MTKLENIQLFLKKFREEIETYSVNCLQCFLENKLYFFKRTQKTLAHLLWNKNKKEI